MQPVADESLRRLIIATYQETVHHAAIPEDLRTALNTNERVPAFLYNLECELARLPRKQQTIDNVTFSTRELTLFFIKNVKLKADQMMMSDAEKSALHTKHTNARVLNNAADVLNKTGSFDAALTEEVISVLNEK